MKWGSPCYTFEGKNVVMMASRRDFCALSFFQGAGFDDPGELLEAPGPNSRYARYLKFRSADDVEEHREAIRDFIEQAIEWRRTGKTVDVSDELEPMPDELEARLESDPALRDAFDELTPGRQRSHILHVGGAKRASTRERRVEKCVPKILAGKGYNER